MNKLQLYPLLSTLFIFFTLNAFYLECGESFFITHIFTTISIIFALCSFKHHLIQKQNAIAVWFIRHDYTRKQKLLNFTARIIFLIPFLVYLFGTIQTGNPTDPTSSPIIKNLVTSILFTINLCFIFLYFDPWDLHFFLEQPT